MSRFAVWKLWCPLKKCTGLSVYGRPCTCWTECLGSGPMADSQPFPDPLFLFQERVPDPLAVPGPPTVDDECDPPGSSGGSM